MKPANIVIVLCIILAAAITLFFIFKRSVPSKHDFTIEWLEITPQTKEQMAPLFDQLEPIFVDAFLPQQKSFFYANDQRGASIPPEQRVQVEPKVSAGITSGLQASWHKKIQKMYNEFENNKISAAYLAIAQDNHQNPIGFALYKKTSIKGYIEAKLEKIIEGSLETLQSTSADQNDLYLNILAVKPGIQKKGIGKALAFSVFDHDPHITTMYLQTYATPLNSNAQVFYEHIGFKRALIGQFVPNEGEPEFVREKIVYMFKNELFILETPRTILRKFTLADVPALSRIMSDPDVVRYFPFGQLDEQATRTYLNRMIEKYKNDGLGKWAVIDKETNELIGMSGIVKMEIDGEASVELGYHLAKIYWGKGLGTEIARTVRDHAFNVLKLEELTAVIDKKNFASQHVAEKIGMKYWKDSILFGKTYAVYRLKRSDVNK